MRLPCCYPSTMRPVSRRRFALITVNHFDSNVGENLFTSFSFSILWFSYWNTLLSRIAHFSSSNLPKMNHNTFWHVLSIWSIKLSYSFSSLHRLKSLATSSLLLRICLYLYSRAFNSRFNAVAIVASSNGERFSLSRISVSFCVPCRSCLTASIAFSFTLASSRHFCSRPISVSWCFSDLIYEQSVKDWIISAVVVHSIDDDDIDPLTWSQCVSCKIFSWSFFCSSVSIICLVWRCFVLISAFSATNRFNCSSIDFVWPACSSNLNFRLSFSLCNRTTASPSIIELSLNDDTFTL